MTVQIETIRDPGALGEFLKLPWRLYAEDPHWIPPLLTEVRDLFDQDKNPFFEHGEIEPCVARRNDRVVGRIAAIRNENHESFHSESCGFFGFFECENDLEVARALLQHARGRVAQWGLRVMRGPVNPSTNDECGNLVEGFDTPPMLLMPHARPYYDELLTGCGLVKAKDLLAYCLETPAAIPARLQEGAKRVRAANPNIVVRPLDRSRFDSEVVRFKEVYNGAWEKNWGFVPMTDAEIDHMASQMKRIIDPGLIRIAEHEGRTVAFALALPDFHQAMRHANGRLFPIGLFKMLWHARNIDRVRVLVLGVIEEYRRRGIDALLYHDLFEYGIAKGYRFAETSWVLEDNVGIRRPIESMGARVYKTYRLYDLATGAE